MAANIIHILFTVEKRISGERQETFSAIFFFLFFQKRVRCKPPLPGIGGGLPLESLLQSVGCASPSDLQIQQAIEANDIFIAELERIRAIAEGTIIDQ
jgi:hypothetical protein